MAANANNEYKVFKYYEGLCSSSDFPKEIAKVLALGVKSNEVTDIDGNVLESPTILKSKNWDIVYPAPDASLGIDLDNLTIDEYKKKILNQVSKVSDTVILKTTTTPKNLTDEEVDELTVDADSNKSSLTMYLEIYKPEYIANPEEYPLDCERKGIIPKVITKEMYRASMQSTKATEEYIYASPICLKESRTDTTTGSATLTYAQADQYVSMINTVYGSMSFGIPSTDGDSTSIVINSAFLAQIKQDSVDLYNLICDSLNGGEGIESKTYSLLKELKIELYKNGGIFTMLLNGVRDVTVYTIPSGSIFTIQNTPVTDLIPELYLDGTYIPLETSKYHTDPESKKIYFDDNIIFEASEDGVLVIRYEYAISGNETITERETMLNNHYCLMRLFDNINETGDGPMDNVYNASGEVITINSHVSPWSKLSWYQDFEEIMIDTIDADVGISNIHDGTLLVPLETPGLNADTKMRYWINTNNDRFSVIVMGNPSLDFSRERHIISGCYCGRIDSFDNSINDTAGNFALFTSSSTEPCNTVLNTEHVKYEAPNFTLTDISSYNVDDFNAFIANCPWHTSCNGNGEYVIELSDKKYYNRNVWPRYVIVDSYGVPVTPYTSAYQRQFIVENGKSNILRLNVEPGHTNYDESYTVYVTFEYYQEKFLITSGVSRDIFGNVTDVSKVNDYGSNTSDGVTSIMMYHTRSKAYYQKHHMMFATTEEYMSKVMYGKSSYTGEYYADRIKVTHGNDGPRGTLSDLLVIDSSSLYALDELVINKDFEKDPDEYEETFVYFPISAPYSPLSDSPNARYGLAIKKSEKEPAYTDETKILKIAISELGTLAQQWWPVTSNIYPREMTSNGCNVYWNIVDGTAWEGDESNPSDYVPLQIAIVNTSAYQGDLTNPILPAGTTSLTPGTIKSDGTTSYVKISGFSSNSGEKVYYGISDTPITSFGKNAQLLASLFDGTSDNEEFIYSIEGVPFGGKIGDSIPATDIPIIDAAPNKYLVIYSVDEQNIGEPIARYNITKFDCIPLKNSGDANALLQYPCLVNAYITGGIGSIVNTQTGTQVSSINTNVEYDSTFKLPVKPAPGYQLDKITVYDSNNVSIFTEYTSSDFQTINIGGNSYTGVILSNVTKDERIEIQFTTV